ncbi:MULTISPECIES: DUF6771 family protein [Sphingobium]|uniref:DUF6771 family protein n=1 Tax=Sphingobium TaxID=165695 RepID=UPI0018D52886|nr:MULTISPECIES: DUF6771 family protein [Sphingobium]
MSATLLQTILNVLEHAPAWIRHDLAGKDNAARARAEETLAAMIEAAIKESDSARL